MPGLSVCSVENIGIINLLMWDAGIIGCNVQNLGIINLLMSDAGIIRL